jgi:hypothetical protein
MEDRQPVFWKVIWVDYWAFLFAAFSILSPLVYVYTIMASKMSRDFSWLLMSFWVATIVGLFWRYRSIISLYNDGLEAKATIIQVGFFRDRGYIKYVYTFENRRFAGRNRVMKNRFTTRYRVGDEVAVLIDREKPQRSLIKDLFL